MTRKRKSLEETYPGAAAAPEFFAPLGPEEEAQFMDWYKQYATETGLATNPDDPQHQYNYRAWWRALNSGNPDFAPRIDPEDNRLHAPSLFKAYNHPNRYVPTNEGMGIMDSITGEPLINWMRPDTIR